MRKPAIVIFNPSNPESLKKKFNHKQKNPNDTFIKSNDKEGLKALKGNAENVVNYDDDFDLRKLKGDKVVIGNKPKTPVKKSEVKKETPKKAAEKKTVKKVATPKKVVTKKVVKKKAPVKKKAVKKKK